MNDDQLLLASAYLDGDVDGAERARAEADVEVMAEVAMMRSVREAMRDVEAPDLRRREGAVAAALATLGDQPAVLAPPAPAVRSFRARRSSWWGGIVAAAAALVLVVGAGVALRGTSSGDDDDAASVATVETADDATLSATDEAPGATERAAAAPAPAAADDGAAEEDSAPVATSAGGSEATTSGDAPGSQVAEVVADLATPADLAAFAAERRSQPYQGPAPACAPDGTFVGPVTFAGAPAEVFEVGTTVTALDATTCRVLATVER